MSFLHHHPEEGARTQIHLLVLPPGVKTPTIGNTQGPYLACQLSVFYPWGVTRMVMQE